MTIPPFFHPSYWFDLTPPPLLPVFDHILLGLFVACFLLGIVGRLTLLRRGWEKMMKKAVQRASNALIVLGCFGLLLYAMSYERIYVLSMRAGYVLWIVLLAWYIWSIVRFVRVEIPETKRRHSEREEIEKWLPKSQRK